MSPGSAGSTTAQTGALLEALKLVRGQPFAGTHPRRYGWADVDRQQMIAAVVDVAHEVSQRAQRNRDVAMSRHAAAVGLIAEPGSEALWRDRLRTEWLAGNHEALEEVADRLTKLFEHLDDDLEPETIELLNELFPRGATSSNTGKASAGGGRDGR